MATIWLSYYQWKIKNLTVTHAKFWKQILKVTKRRILDGSIHHYNDVIMSAMASQITSLTIVYSTVYSGTDQRKHQSSASLAFVRGIHRWPVNSPHKGPVTRKMFSFDDVIMIHQVKKRRSNERAGNKINLATLFVLHIRQYYYLYTYQVCGE